MLLGKIMYFQMTQIEAASGQDNLTLSADKEILLLIVNITLSQQWSLLRNVLLERCFRAGKSSTRITGYRNMNTGTQCCESRMFVPDPGS
jgi:hypothetical protein